jgi:hypothetical protein
MKIKIKTKIYKHGKKTHKNYKTQENHKERKKRKV